MNLPACDICQKLNASILICLEHDGQTEKHHVCMDCVGELADSELADLLNQSNLDFTKLKSILEQMQNFQEPDETDLEEIATLQKLQAMMGNDGESDSEDVTNQATEKVLSKDDAQDSPCCSECGTSWKSIHEDGLVGCPHCYVTFEELLQKVVEKLHRCPQHTGKVPRFLEKQQRLKEHQEKREKHRVEMLQHRLDAAITSENYEEAAQIRDKIKEVSKAKY